MSDTLHPPYSPTTIQLRQLNRWLDVNSQNGPLGRTRGFLTLPFGDSFSYSGGLNNKILQLNFSASNNFSIINDALLTKFVSDIDSNGGIGLTIANVIATPVVRGKLNFNKVVRYRFNTVLAKLGDVPLYAGQEILGKYFQIELWRNAAFSGAAPVWQVSYVLTTSVLGTVDYRYGEDFQLHSAAAVPVTNFKQTNGAGPPYNLPLIYNPNTINGVN